MLLPMIRVTLDPLASFPYNLGMRLTSFTFARHPAIWQPTSTVTIESTEAEVHLVGGGGGGGGGGALAQKG